MMAKNTWLYLATLLTIVVYVYSEQEDDPDRIQNDPEAFSHHPGNSRMPRGRNGGGPGGLSDSLAEERDLPREERKRIKAQRRRLKEERRQERWARRRQQKQEGNRGRLDEVTDVPEAEERDVVVHRSQHNQVISRGVPVTLSSSSVGVPGGSSGGVPAATQSIHTGVSASLPSSRTSSHTRSRGSSNSVDMEPTPTVVDLEWMRANLSALWSVVRTLSRPQGRGGAFLHRGGGRGRHHHSGVVAEPPNPALCPGGEDACRSEGGKICGEQGVCSCGHCFCHPGYYGTFCQCNDHSCPVYDGMTCGGPSRGQCRCGGCICRRGYAGESCDCPTDTQTCISPDNDTICSDKGTCECGRCRCSDGHKGMYCEDTVYAAGVCEKLKSCVMCKAWKRDLPSCAQCQITVTTVDKLEPSMTKCVMVNSGCLLQFSYIPQTAEAYSVLVRRDMVCPTT